MHGATVKIVTNKLKETLIVKLYLCSANDKGGAKNWKRGVRSYEYSKDLR
jgi:hypothetical protein